MEFYKEPSSHNEVRKFQAALLAAGLKDTDAGLFEWHTRSGSWVRISDAFTVEGHRHNASGRHRGSYLGFTSFVHNRVHMIDLPDSALRSDPGRLASRLRAAGLFVERGREESFARFVRICRSSFGRLIRVIYYRSFSQEPGRPQLAA
jgi:hypothetical protein